VRHSYTDDPALLPRVLDLLGSVFPGLPEVEATARPLGLRWEETSTPFLAWEGDMPVAHVGVLEVPLVMRGKERTVGGIHAVATHPDHRGRGHYRRTMESALAHCDTRFETLLLTTDQPRLYEPFGFRVVSESRFVGELGASGGASGFRLLDLGRESDRALLLRLLYERAPVSEILCVVSERDIFLFYECARPLRYCAELDLLLCADQADGVLKVRDIVSPRIPPLAEVLRRMTDAFERVEVYFAADRLGAGLVAEEHRLDGDDHLMVRGPFPPEGDAFMLPIPARC
jgi:GNAT superfamily N-acetyltransferase